MKLFYRKLGHGKPIFIVHGLFGLSDNWVTAGKILSQNFEVYLLDLRNHGNSPHNDEWTYPAMAEDIKETIDEVTKSAASAEISKPILIGHSLGGKVAMQFASMFPEMLEKLIVVDMAPRDQHPKVFDFVKHLPEMDLAKLTSRKEIEQQLASFLKEDAISQLLLKNIQWNAANQLQWKFNLKVIAENVNTLGHTFKIKTGIETSVLFILGEKSDYIRETDIPEIKKYFPNSEIQTITGAGHWVHADKPKEFVECVLNFTRRFQQ